MNTILSEDSTSLENNHTVEKVWKKELFGLYTKFDSMKI